MSWQTGENVGFPNNLRCDISVIVPCQQSALCFKIYVKRTPKETLEEEGRVSYPPLTLPWSLLDVIRIAVSFISFKNTLACNLVTMERKLCCKGGFRGGPRGPRPPFSGLLNISALHVQYGIQAFAKFKRPKCTRLHLSFLKSY